MITHKQKHIISLSGIVLIIFLVFFFVRHFSQSHGNREPKTELRGNISQQEKKRVDNNDIPYTTPAAQEQTVRTSSPGIPNEISFNDLPIASSTVEDLINKGFPVFSSYERDKTSIISFTREREFCHDKNSFGLTAMPKLSLKASFIISVILL